MNIIIALIMALGGTAGHGHHPHKHGQVHRLPDMGPGWHWVKPTNPDPWTPRGIR